MPADHLDDEVISDALDGVALAAPAADHLASCPACESRFALMRGASTLVATPVPPLEPAAVDALVDRAVTSSVVSLEKRRRLLRTVPPPWVVAVAAAAALLLGVPALLRSTSTDEASSSNLTALDSTDAATGAGGSGRAATSDDASLSVPEGLGMGGHLGSLDSEATLADGLRARLDQPSGEPHLVARPAMGAVESGEFRTSGRDDAGDGESDAGDTDAAGSQARATEPKSPPPPSCADTANEGARAAGAEAGALVYLAPVTWKGENALVYVYALAHPDAEGRHRHALVTTLPGCDVVVSLRF